ncbi:MAG: FeoA family protein [Phycisphaerales bacterium]
MTADGCPSLLVSLNQLKPGQTGVVVESRLGVQDAALLGAMGLRCSATIKVCRVGEPCIVSILGGGSGCSHAAAGSWGACRIGLARPLAEQIMVRRSE